MRQLHANHLFALAAAIMRKRAWRLLPRLAEDAVFATALIFAMGHLSAESTHAYAAFFLAGIAPWFYLKDVLLGLSDFPDAFVPLFMTKGRSPAWAVLMVAFTSLPVLFLWMLLARIFAMTAGLPYVSIAPAVYLIVCIFCCAIMQGMAAAALAGIFPGNRHAAASILLPLFFWTTPIVWPATILPQQALLLAKGNPLFYVVELSRGVLLPGQPPDIAHALVFFLLLALMGGFGLFVLQQIRKTPLALRP